MWRSLWGANLIHGLIYILAALLLGCWRHGPMAAALAVWLTVLGTRRLGNAQLQSRTTRSFGPRFPLLDGALAGIQIAGKYWLAHTVVFAKTLDLRGRNLGCWCKG
jgi:hypothetical protein